MYGLLFLIIGGFYLAVVAGLLFWGKPLWGKGLVLVVAILIPNADDWYYQHELALYCKNEAGFKVYQQLSKREGVVSDHFLHSENFATVTPLAFIERAEERPNDIGKMVATYWRSDRLPDGSASKPYAIPQYSAAYEAIKTTTREEPFLKTNYQIVRRADHQIMGEFKTLAYDGGWYRRVIIGPGLVAACGDGGKVLSRKEWGKKENWEFEGVQHTLYKLINQTFTVN